MTLSAKELRELRGLTVKLHEGQLSDEEGCRLKSQLADSEESRRIFSAYTAMVALLEVELPTLNNEDSNISAENIESELPPSLDLNAQDSTVDVSPHTGLFFTAFQNTVGFFSQEIPFALLIATVLTGLGLWGASLVYVSRPEQMARRGSSSSLPSQTATDPFQNAVGRITAMVDCRWATKGLGIRDWGLETAVSLGDKFTLTSGLMEITYDTGAKVILQGPVMYEVDSRDGGFLSVGRLTARLEKKQSAISGQQSEPAASMANHKSEIINQKSLASSPQPLAPNSNPQSVIPNPPLSTLHSPLFTIKTPTATVTDLGTEFGVEVLPSGVTSSYVFQGIIEMQPTTKNSASVRLTADESAQVDVGDGGKGVIVRRIKADSTLFVRSEQLPKLAAVAENNRTMTRFQRWQAYSQKLRHDPSLAAYYDFQQQKGKPAQLPNVADSTIGFHDGVVNNATWSNGRMPGKHALLFRNPTDHVRIDLPQKLNDLTLAAWVFFDTLETSRGNTGLLMSENEGLHWQVRNDDGLVGLSAGRRGNAEGWRVVLDYQYRQWMFLACTYDHTASQVRFFINGNGAGKSDWPADSSLIIGPAWIGNWKQQIRNLRGRMDELAVFSRALAPDEVERMFQRGKP